MRNLFLMVFALSGFFGQILGSEKSKRLYHLQENYNEKISSPFDLLCIKETRFYAKVTVAYNLLCYSDKNYINFLNQNYGIKCSDNEPFIRIQYLGMHKDQQNLKEKFIDLITLVPLRYFLVGETIQKEGNVFKLKNNALLSFSVCGEEKPVRIRLDEDFVVPMNKAVGDEGLKELLKRFKETSTWIYEVGDKQKRMEADYDILKQELLDKGILMENSDEITTHGPNSYFGEEIKVALFYARVKTLLCCGSLGAAILMYALYQKFYVTAG